MDQPIKPVVPATIVCPLFRYRFARAATQGHAGFVRQPTVSPHSHSPKHSKLKLEPMPDVEAEEPAGQLKKKNMNFLNVHQVNHESVAFAANV